MSKSKPDRAGSPSLFGLETEYAYVAKLKNGSENKGHDDDGLVFLRTAMSQLAHLPGARCTYSRNHRMARPDSPGFLLVTSGEHFVPPPERIVAFWFGDFALVVAQILQ